VKKYYGRNCVIEW